MGFFPEGRAWDHALWSTWRIEMTLPHKQINLADVEDAAPTGGFGDRWEARVARVDLEAAQTGVTHFRLRPGKRSPFAHRHGRAEEVYVILAGTGRVKLDDEIAEPPAGRRRSGSAIRSEPSSRASSPTWWWSTAIRYDGPSS